MLIWIYLSDCFYIIIFYGYYREFYFNSISCEIVRVNLDIFFEYYLFLFLGYIDCYKNVFYLVRIF